MTILIALLLTSCLTLAQPYEPTFLLDVTGEVEESIGRSVLMSVGDQDGDGFDDILTKESMGFWSNVLRLYYGSNTGEVRYTRFGNVDSSELDHFWWSADFTQTLGDVNGDGEIDIFLDLQRRTEDFDLIYRPVLFLGGPVLFDTIPDWSGEWGNNYFTTNVGDYDGDGRDDVTRRPLNAQYFGFYRSADPLPTEPTWTYIPNRDHMGFGDFNNDGFSDFGMSYQIVSQDMSEADLFLGSEDADSLPALIFEFGPSFWEGEDLFHFVGDINGDGFDDLISDFSSAFTGEEKHVYYGGDPPDLIVDEVFYEIQGDVIPHHAIGLGDINDDGYDDFALYDMPGETGPEGIEIYLGGDPPTFEPVWTLDSPYEGMVCPYRIGPAGDFNGDGIDDWMFSCYEGGERRGRIIVVAGDERFGLPAHEAPDIAPSSFVLHPCYPNPFNSSVTIPLEITGSGAQAISVTIYNTLGQEVYSYPFQTYEPGPHRLFWSGQTNNNTPTSGGVYFLVATTKTAHQTMKLMYVP